MHQNFINKNRLPRIFIDVTSDAVQVDERVVVILSPAFYWVKRQALPVSYAFQAKAYIDSVFDGFLPPNDYSYEVIKEGDEFLFFAYVDQEILSFLEGIGIAQAHIGAIYFAQTEFALMDEPLLISPKSAMYVDNGIVVQIPAVLAQEAQSIDAHLGGLALSSHTIAIQKFTHIVSPKQLNMILAILVLILVLVGVENTIYRSMASDLQTQESAVFETYDLPSTMVQNRTIFKRLEALKEEQIGLREAIDGVLKTPLNAGEFINTMTLQNGTLNLEIKVSDKERAEVLKKYYQANVKSFSLSKVKVIGRVVEVGFHEAN
jgi:hypothetical protein